MDTALAFGELGNGLPVVEHRQRKFQSHLLTQQRKAKFINYIKQRDLSQLALIRDTLGVDEYEKEKARLFARFDAGEYGFYGPVIQKALTQAPEFDASGKMTRMPDIEAFSMFVACIFDCTPDDAMILLAERAGDVSPIIARVLYESMPTVKTGGSDPNG